MALERELRLTEKAVELYRARVIAALEGAGIRPSQAAHLVQAIEGLIGAVSAHGHVASTKAALENEQ